MRLILLIFVCLISACATHLPTNPVQSAEDFAFTQQMDQIWQYNLSQNPTAATGLGVRDYDQQLGDYSLAQYDRQVEQAKAFVAQLERLNVAGLSADNALNHELLMLALNNEIEASRFGGKYQILTNRSGPHLSLAQLPNRLPFRTPADYQSYLSRLALIPQANQQIIERLMAGVQAGWVQPCKPMQGYDKSIQTHVVENVADSNFMQPFAKRPAAISQSEFAAFKAKAETLVREQVVPAFAEFERFYREDYAPAWAQKVGVSNLPGGDEFYAFKVRSFTTTQLTPEEVHNIGLAEVKRIRAEMDEVIASAGFDGDFKQWQAYLRSNPDFYPKTPNERMAAVAVIMKKMDGLLPSLFSRFPRMPYGLKEIPKDIAEKTTTAYYQGPAGDGSRAGFYFVNTSKLDTRPLHELEALSLHEAVPGHHFQIALAQELDLPEFRRHGGVTAFVEGWGLYAERLGLEVGFYQTPYTNFGRLSYEMWRACRLVVDTGMHAKGWTRQQAIDFMAENSGLSLNNITTEVDRYITWPGQALAYKIGEMKIRELRARAEAALGKDFDVRHFHDAVLENGAIPLSVLEGKIDSWIAAEKLAIN